MDSDHFRIRPVVARVAQVIIIAGGMAIAVHGEPVVWPGPDLPDDSARQSFSRDGYRDLRTIALPSSETALVLDWIKSQARPSPLSAR